MGRTSNGHAISPFQVEYATAGDILWNDLPNSDYVSYYPYASDLQKGLIIARLYLLRYEEKLPSANDQVGMAVYWKVYWNTSEGAGKVSTAVKKYRKYR